MLENLKRLINAESTKTVMEEAAEKVIVDDDDSIKDAFLDDVETMVVGAENDPEIKKIVDSLPEVADEAEPITQDDLKKMVESYVPESIIHESVNNTLIESDFSDLGVDDEPVIESFDFDFDFDSLEESTNDPDLEPGETVEEDNSDDEEPEFDDDEGAEESFNFDFDLDYVFESSDDDENVEESASSETEEPEDEGDDDEVTESLLTSLFEAFDEEISSDEYYDTDDVPPPVDDTLEGGPADEVEPSEDDIDNYDNDVDDFIDL